MNVDDFLQKCRCVCKCKYIDVNVDFLINVDFLHVYDIVNLLYVHTYVYVHINHAGRLLWKTEYQCSDFYIQLAADFLLEVYQETGTVNCYTIYYVLFEVAHLQITLVSYGTQPSCCSLAGRGAEVMHTYN